MNLNLPWRIWICRGEFEFAAVNLNLPRWILNLPWWIWICRGEFEFAAVNFKFALVNLNLDLPWWIWICRDEFEFAVTVVGHRTKLPFLWQTFKSKTNLSFWWQNFFTTEKLFNQSVGGGTPLAEDDGVAGSDSFIDPIFSGLCPF